jgi:hypothetical protein
MALLREGALRDRKGSTKGERLPAVGLVWFVTIVENAGHRWPGGDLQGAVELKARKEKLSAGEL